MGGLRLFGVQLDLFITSSSSSASSTGVALKKSFSTDYLSSSSSSSVAAAAASSTPSSSSSNSRISPIIDENYSDKMSNGYLSDGLIARAQERKKGEYHYITNYQYMQSG